MPTECRKVIAISLDLDLHCMSDSLENDANFRCRHYELGHSLYICGRCLGVRL